MMLPRILLAALMLTIPSYPVLAQDGKPASAQTAGLNTSLDRIQAEWARIKYQVPGKEQKLSAISTLGKEAAALTAANPQSADAKIWEAIVLATDASITKSLSGLSKVERAKKLLEEAIRINPKAQDGYAFTTLGSLYYQVPGWPVAFGSNELAEKNFKQALAIDPDGMDINFWYGEFLKERGDTVRARQHLEKALNAPKRPGPDIADSGRRTEIRQSLAELEKTGKKPKKTINQ